MGAGGAARAFGEEGAGERWGCGVWEGGDWDGGGGDGGEGKRGGRSGAMGLLLGRWRWGADGVIATTVDTAAVTADVADMAAGAVGEEDGGACGGEREEEEGDGDGDGGHDEEKGEGG